MRWSSTHGVNALPSFLLWWTSSHSGKTDTNYQNLHNKVIYYTFPTHNMNWINNCTCDQQKIGRNHFNHTNLLVLTLEFSGRGSRPSVMTTGGSSGTSPPKSISGPTVAANNRSTYRPCHVVPHYGWQICRKKSRIYIEGKVHTDDGSVSWYSWRVRLGVRWRRGLQLWGCSQSTSIITLTLQTHNYN